MGSDLHFAFAKVNVRPHQVNVRPSQTPPLVEKPKTEALTLSTTFGETANSSSDPQPHPNEIPKSRAVSIESQSRGTTFIRRVASSSGTYFTVGGSSATITPL